MFGLTNRQLMIAAIILVFVYFMFHGDLEEDFWLWNGYPYSYHKYHYPPYYVGEDNYTKFHYNPYYYKQWYNPYYPYHKWRRFFYNRYHLPNEYRYYKDGHQYNSPFYGDHDPHMKRHHYSGKMKAVSKKK